MPRSTLDERGSLPLENTVSQRPDSANGLTRGPWTLAALGLVLYGLAWWLQGDERGLWLPGLGLGVALVSWIGWRILPALAAVLLLVRGLTGEDAGITLILVDSALHLLLIGLAWWLYFE